jgi:hypothetical protein
MLKLHFSVFTMTCVYLVRDWLIRDVWGESTNLELDFKGYYVFRKVLRNLFITHYWYTVQIFVGLEIFDYGLPWVIK